MFNHYTVLIIALIMTNTLACARKLEAWTWYLPSNLVPAKSFVRGVYLVLSTVFDIKKY